MIFCEKSNSIAALQEGGLKNVFLALLDAFLQLREGKDPIPMLDEITEDGDTFGF